MSKYSYKAQSLETGAEVTGTAEAVDKFELAKNMKAEGKLLLTAMEMSTKGFSVDMDAINAFLATVKLREKIVFSRNLATMIAAGLALSRALGIVVKQTKNPKFRITLRAVLDDLQRGMPLSDAMEKFPKIFPQLMVSMVRAGEESGGLVDALNVVGGQMEKTYTLKKKVRGAMMYPAIVLCVMIGVGVLMMIYVVPGLTSAFTEAGVKLPPLTQALVAISEFLMNHGVLAAILAIAIGVAFWQFARTTFGGRVIAWVVLRFPIFGTLVKEYNSALVTRTMSSLIAAGVGILRTIDITKDVVANVFYKETLDRAKDNIQKGIPMSQVFRDHPEIYPVMVGDMMEVGEETGKLSDMLMKIAAFYEEEVDQATADMSKLVEPLLMVVIAIGVGIFAIAMITPMYTLMTSI